MTTEPRPAVLFVCVHNAGRSQMAAALLRRRAGDRIAVRSAGSAPAEGVNPAATEVMWEIGIDLADATPKLLSTDSVRTADVIVTMGCDDACPVFPGKRYETWELEDPAGKDVGTVRGIRDEIDRRVQRLADRLLGAG